MYQIYKISQGENILTTISLLHSNFYLVILK
jgi:hypothetical protein